LDLNCIRLTLSFLLRHSRESGNPCPFSRPRDSFAVEFTLNKVNVLLRMTINFCLTLPHTGVRLMVIVETMNIGVGKVSLRIPENMDLKGKRQVLKSITGRIRSRFDVAVAEVDDNDAWQLATIGFCCISNNKRFSNQVLSRVYSFIENSHFDIEILDYEIEIIDV
jgi:uncharacterized protein YlxP (DUF503 family)